MPLAEDKAAHREVDGIQLRRKSLLQKVHIPSARTCLSSVHFLRSADLQPTVLNYSGRSEQLPYDPLQEKLRKRPLLVSTDSKENTEFCSLGWGSRIEHRIWTVKSREPEKYCQQFSHSMVPLTKKWSPMQLQTDLSLKTKVWIRLTSLAIRFKH